jgi:hypothetical protein
MKLTLRSGLLRHFFLSGFSLCFYPLTSVLRYRALFFVFFSTWHFLSCPLQADEPQADESLEKPKKYHFSICAIFKDEAKFLKEWIEYHQLIGVDHFYLYNCSSQDHFLKVLNPYLKKGVVTLVDWFDYFDEQDEEETYKWALSTQISAYEHVIRMHAEKETKWLVFADIDEFFLPPGSTALAEVLKKYDDYPGILLESDYFDASKWDVLPKRKLIIEALELTNAPHQNLQKSVLKMIFKPDLCLGFTWPPYTCTFKDHRIPTGIGKSELRINRYTNRKAGYLFRKFKDKLLVDNRVLAADEMRQLLALGYEIEDQERAIYRFVTELTKKMENDPGHGW